MEMIDVLLVVQHQIVREGIEKILADEPNISVKDAAGNIDVLSDISMKKRCVLVLDLDIDELNASKVLNQHSENNSELKTLIITEKRNPEHIKKLIEMGASGFLFKDRNADKLIQAIKKVYQGETYLCEEAEKMLSNVSDYSQDVENKRRENLTDREREVLVLICEEFTNREIADKLCISVRTVDAHRRNVLQKTGAKNTAGMVKYAIKNKLYRA